MPATDLSLLQDAAAEAGEIALSYFGRKPRIWDKDDNAGPVTEADLAVNEMLETALRKARPDYGWLSEETDDNEERLSTKRQFVIDPIDGTRAFIDGSHDWSHSLAVVEEGRVTAAVVHLPAKGRTYSAALGHGATRDADQDLPDQQAPGYENLYGKGDAQSEDPDNANDSIHQADAPTESETDILLPPSYAPSQHPLFHALDVKA